MPIIFDWDGTLADSVNAIIACKQFLAAQYHLPTPRPEVIKQVLGKGFDEAMAICFPTATPLLLTTLCHEFQAVIQQDVYQTKLFPYVKDMLLTLKANHIKLAVATSKSRVALNKALLDTGLSDNVFDMTCCSEEYEAKPHPRMLHYMMRELSVSAEDCLLVGDTTHDMLFAKNASIKAVGVSFGAHSPEELIASGASRLIDTWAEFLSLIDQPHKIKKRLPHIFY